MSVENQRNTYMEEVMQQQQAVAQELKAKRAMPPSMSAPARARMVAGPAQAQRAEPEWGGGGGVSGPAVDVRITGFWRWRTVIVPPNAWVVHTRRGQKEPLHLGLGTSFGFDPTRDAFLVAPATMQTLTINAKCICSERQGILVQGYVQWIIDDFRAAYQKIDFSDTEDPMRIVNVQLREQAEASIKDKVATMSIDEVLADKRPIIDELTARLRSVAEGQGLKIVTVQIKEAVVSSTRLWENLQKPFRENQARIARLAEIDRETAVRERELAENTKRLRMEEEAARQAIADKAETDRIKQKQLVETAKAKSQIEQERTDAELLRIAQERRIEEAERARALANAEADQARQLKESQAWAERQRLKLDVEALQRKLDNDVTPLKIDADLVKLLPLIVKELPKPERLETVTISGGGDALQLAGIVKALRAVLVDGKADGRG